MPNNSTFQDSPNSPATWPRDAFPVWPSILAIIGGVAFYIACAILLLRWFGKTLQPVNSAQLTPGLVEAQVLSYVPIIAYMALVLPIVAHRPLRKILGPLNSRAILAGLGGAVFMWLAIVGVGALESLLFGRQPTQTAVKLFENAHPGIWLDLMAVVAVTLGPFAEELIFRGFLFNALWKHMPFGAAALVSSIVFGFAHGQIGGVAPLAAGGFVLATVYARTGSLWSSMISHGTFNGVTLALLLLAGIKT